MTVRIPAYPAGPDSETPAGRPEQQQMDGTDLFYAGSVLTSTGLHEGWFLQSKQNYIGN